MVCVIALGGGAPRSAAAEPPLSGSLLSTPPAQPAAKGSSPLGGSLLTAPSPPQPATKQSSPLGGSLLAAPSPATPGASAPSAAPPSASTIFSPSAPPPASPKTAGPANDLSHYREMADKLYKATSSDAALFQQAIGNPELRRRLEQTLKIPLTDERLSALAAHARTEAAYWAAYRRGLAAKAPEAEKPKKVVSEALPPWSIGSALQAPPGPPPPASHANLPGGFLSSIFPIGAETPPPGVSDKPVPLLGVGQLPRRPQPLLEIGNGFLATGPLSQGFELPGGTVWQPRLWVFGTMRSAVQEFYNGKTHYGEWANRLDLFANLQLTGTERLVVGMQPFSHDASGAFSGWQFAPGPSRGKDDLNANVRTLFFEGDLGSTLPILDKKGILPIDFGYTIGRQPLFYQNGMLINDNVTMVGIARNSIQLPHTSNVLVDFVYAWDHVQRPNRPLTLTGQQPSLWGIATSSDVLDATYDIEMLHVSDARAFGDAWYIGGAAIRRIGLLNTALRINSSIADGPETAVSTNGTLLSLETSFNPFRSDDIVYFNPYVAFGNFTQAAKDPIVAGPLGGLGITFAGYGIGTAVAPLSSAAHDVAGFATGYQAFWDAHRRSLTLELGVRENTAPNGSFNAQAIGARFQQAIGQRVLLEFDATFTRQENHNNAFGLRTELDYQF
jgi:hypothetical protein